MPSHQNKCSSVAKRLNIKHETGDFEMEEMRTKVKVVSNTYISFAAHPLLSKLCINFSLVCSTLFHGDKIS